MKIVQLIEAKLASGGPTYKKLSNEKIFSMFMIREPELSDEGENDHFYTRKEIHIYDKGDDGEINWVVVYPPGTIKIRQGRPGTRRTPNKETVFFSIDHDNDREWQTNPQKWQISHLQVLFDG